MDVDWAIERLEAYLSLCRELTIYQRRNGQQWDNHCQELNDRAVESIATVSKIVKSVDPIWFGTLMPPSYVGDEGERIVRQALGALRDRDEWATRLASKSPVLQADQMHALVWRAASTVWDTGEYKLAVQQAAIAVSALVKSRTGSPLNDRALMQMVFASESPKAGQVRLHLPGDRDDDNWKSRQQGLHLMAQGAFAGIRNIAVHEEARWSEHEALEHLAVLSVVARWADAADLVAAEARS